MNLLFQLSGEHPKLPKAEILGVLEGKKIEYEILEERKKERLLLTSVKTKKTDFIKRLALTKKAAKFVSKKTSLERLATELKNALPKSKKTFAVRSSSHSVEKKLGARVAKKAGLKVKLKEPDIKIVCFPSSKTYYAGIELPLERNFEQRKPHFRPYFSPTSLHPKLARVLVNLARVKPGAEVLDPFCGTGGILIEAAMIGMKVKGFDYDERAVEGCKKNLEFYQLKGKIRQGDARQLTLKKKVNAIVTDLPYGRSSIMTEKKLGKLYEEFLSSAAKNLKEKGHVVIMIPEGNKTELDNHFHLLESYEIYVHKSLSRKVLVLRKK